MNQRDSAIHRLHLQAYTVINGFSPDVSPYRDAPSALVESDMVRGARLNVDLFFRYLSTQMMPTAEELGPLVELAAMRHRDGVSLEDILTTYQDGASLIWDHMATEFTPAEHLLLVESASALVRYLAVVTGRIAVAWRPTVDPDPTPARVEARRAVATALLAGTDPPPAAVRRVGPLAARYSVLVIEPADDSDGSVLRDIHTRTNAIDGVLTVANREGWITLMPVCDDDPDGEDVRRLVDDLMKDVPGERERPMLWAGLTNPTAQADIPTAHAEALTLCSTGRAVGRGDLVCTAASVLGAYIVTSAHTAHPHLLRVARMLDDDAVARETLWTFLDHGCSPMATAAVMHVHRNTVTYRLNRITRLTGHDPQVPEGNWVLAAARLVSDFLAPGGIPQSP